MGKVIIKNFTFCIFFCTVVFLTLRPYAVPNYYNYLIEIYNEDLNEYNNFMAGYKKILTQEYDNVRDQILSNQNASGYGDFLVDLNIYEEYNNSVGNEWKFGCSINGEKVNDGDIIHCPLNSPSVFYVVCMEDDSIPDIADHTFSYQIYDGMACYAVLTTVENAGRYAGNAASHKFSFSFDRYIDEDLVRSTAKTHLPLPPSEPKKPIKDDISLSFFETIRWKPSILVLWGIIFLIFIVKSKVEYDVQKNLKKETP